MLRVHFISAGKTDISWSDHENKIKKDKYLHYSPVPGGESGGWVLLLQR